jgi:diaminopimelate epimerase
MRISKLHGTGNDFLVTVALQSRGERSAGAPGAEVARALCDRHRGVGADGLITLLPGVDGADCTMELRNADGRVAEMSGNGIRCLAWVANREGLGTEERLVVDTGGGRRTVEGRYEGVEMPYATVDMGAVTFEPGEIPLAAPSAFGLEATFHGVTYEGDAAGIGNPHLVLFVDDVDSARVTQHGPRLECDERFPNRTNVEFVQVVDPKRLRMRVWERGVGETLSCGTGVCATAAAAHRRGLAEESVVVEVPGGEHIVGVGETVHLGGGVLHGFDAPVDERELVRRLA